MQHAYFETEHAIIRVPEMADIPKLIAYYKENQMHLSRYDFFYPGCTQETFWQKRIPVQRQEHQNGMHYRWFVFDPKQEKIIGILVLLNVQYYTLQSAMTGCALASSHCGKGLMSQELMPWLIQFAFKSLNLHRLQAACHPENQRCQRLLSAVGFCQEGVASQFFFNGREWYDGVLFRLINPHWQKPVHLESFAINAFSNITQALES